MKRVIPALRRVVGAVVAPFRSYMQRLLLLAFVFVAAVPVLGGTVAISHSIRDYLATAQKERIRRDMSLASAFYDIKLSDIAGIANRLQLDEGVVTNLGPASRGDAGAIAAIDRLIANKVSVLALGGSHFVAVLDQHGQVVAGRTVSQTGLQSPVPAGGDWSGLDIVEDSVRTGLAILATEVVPASFLASVGLADQASIALVETPFAEPVPFDDREGTAGLVVMGVTPIRDANWQVLGVAIAFHLFNRDYALVDRVREVAGVDTVTIFLGDQRVTTNVMTLEGERAIGTRLSTQVVQKVLLEGDDYSGRAFVVKENYITSYRPLRDHTGAVVGSLYVGAREASFLTLVNSFNGRVTVISVAAILLALMLAIPVAGSVTSPIMKLVAVSHRVAGGDMSARVAEKGRGELAMLSSSFNSMVQELQATQDQLVQAEKLASLGQLAAGVAHELNNPLGTVLLYSDIVLRETPPDDPHRDDLNVIVRETTRCKGIVNALLNFSRQQRLSVQPTDVNELLNELLDQLPRQTDGARLEIVREMDPSLPIIQADTGQLRQVFVNLLSNAIDAMPGGGRLIVRSAPNKPEGVRIEVEDTGCGIREDHIPRLFEPFFTTKPFGKGTGLGLAIVYGIVKMHRGRIHVRSREGVGSVFEITLPLALPAAEPVG